MDKRLIKLNALLKEAKEIVDDINADEETTNFSILRVEIVDNAGLLPQVHLYQGISQFPVPTTSILQECDDGNFVEDYLIIGDVRYYEIDAKKKEADDNAKMAV